MFSVNLTRNEFILNQRFSKLLSRFARLFSESPPTSTEHISAAVVDPNDYVRYRFPKSSEIDDSIGTRRLLFDSSFTVVPDIVSEDEESRLIGEIEKSLKRLRYQHDHWDDAIHGYRETEISAWKDPNNTSIIQRLRDQIFANGLTEPMQRVHILDLCDNGYVKPHIDSIRFCGNIIAGLSLLSDSVMCLADEKNPDTFAVYALLPRRSLYIMKDDVRYKYTHEILSDGMPSVFNDKHIVRQRRVSIVMRNEPPINDLG